MVSRLLIPAIIFFACCDATSKARPVLSAVHSQTDSLAALQRIKERTIDYMLGKGARGRYMTSALRKTDTWVEAQLQKKYRPLVWDETASLIMNQRLAGLASELHTLAIAYRSQGSRFEGNQQVKDRIAAGVQNILQYYRPGTQRPGNWYQWLITLPNHLGATGLLMEQALPSAMLTQLKESLEHELSPRLILTGTNASWEARNHIYLALIEGDVNRLGRAADYVFRSIRYGPDQGIREDYCYLFHGRIPYAGGYGAGFAQTVTEFIYVFDGTPCSIQPVHRDIITNLLLEHTRWFLADGKIDLHVRGRSFREGSGNWNLVLEALLVLAQTNDPRKKQIASTAAAMLNARPHVDLDVTSAGFADRLPTAKGELPLGFRYWPSGEIGVFRQPTYHVAFRQFSSRVQDYEYLARSDGGSGGEGWNLPYGFTNIVRHDSANNWYKTADDGAMLNEIDMNHLPGTTTRIGAHPQNPPFRQDPNVPSMSTSGFSLNFGTSHFAGGVGGDSGGVTGFILEPVYGEFTAKKSLHFFDGGFWALGSSISSSEAPKGNAGKPVHTTILQWASHSEEPLLTVGDERLKLEGDSEQILKKVKWLWIHDEKVGVVFDKRTDISVRMKGKVITLWLDHGVSPSDDDYAYAVLPDIDLHEAEAFNASMPFRPVRYDEQVHAVADANSAHAGIVFFQPQSCLGIESKTPAVIFRSRNENGGIFTIQDPLHGNKKLRLSVAGITGQITNPDEAVVVRQDANDTAHFVVTSVLGRIYRLGYGKRGTHVVGVPRKDLHLSDYRAFQVEAESDAEKTILTVHLPEEAAQGEYKVSVHFSKSQRFHDFTEADVVERPTRNIVRYRWNREPAIGPPVFAGYLNLSDGKFNLLLVTELIAVEDSFVVPKFK